MTSSKLAVIVTVLAIAAATLGGCGGSSDPTAQVNRVVCIDSTTSTDGNRMSYLPDLLEVAEAAVNDHAWLAVSACGANSTGTVRWPIREELVSRQAISGTLAQRFVKKTTEKLKPRLERVLSQESHHNGTPLGEMLSVLGRQCEAIGGTCHAYLFTDGGWADGQLKIRYGVTKAEQEDYVQTYAPDMKGLAGASVCFVGVGYGTHLGEKRLREGRQVATSLVEQVGGHVTSWNVRLPSGGV